MGTWNKILLFLVMLMYAFTTLSAQTFALKSNLLYDAAAVPELSVEVRTAKSATFSLSAVYNPISYSDSRQWKTWSVNPELRFWGSVEI